MMSHNTAVLMKVALNKMISINLQYRNFTYMLVTLLVKESMVTFSKE